MKYEVHEAKKTKAEAEKACNAKENGFLVPVCSQDILNRLK